MSGSSRAEGASGASHVAGSSTVTGEGLVPRGPTRGGWWSPVRVSQAEQRGYIWQGEPPRKARALLARDGDE